MAITAADKSIGDSASINGNFTTSWGADLDNNSSGFTENIDINFNWDVGGWGDYSSDISGIDFNKAYGMAFVSGGLIRFKLESDINENDLEIDNNSGRDLLDVQILLENAWAKIILKDFYIQVAADGTFYNREAGYNHDYSRDILRSNWAHIGSRIKQSYILNSDKYNVSGDMDVIKSNGSSAGISFGFNSDNFKTYLSLGSPNDMYNNTENKYDMVWASEMKPFKNIIINTSAYSGVNYNYQPLGFGSSISYKKEITKPITLEPFVAFDGKFQPKGNNDFGYFNREIAYGLTLSWPGSNGWGYEWLYDESRGTEYGFEANYSKRYSGLTISGNLVTVNDTSTNNLQISLFEEAKDGLIDNLGGSLLFELKDFTEELQYAYGAYAEYNFYDIFSINSRIENKNSLDENVNIYWGSGISWLDIPNTVFTLRYDNEDITNNTKSYGSIQFIINLSL